MTTNARELIEKIAANSAYWRRLKKPMATGSLKDDPVLNGWDNMFRGIAGMTQDQASALRTYGGTMNGVTLKGSGSVPYTGRDGRVVYQKVNPNLRLQDGNLVDTRSGMGFQPGGKMLASTEKQMQMDRKAQAYANRGKTVSGGSMADIKAGKSVIRQARNGNFYRISMGPNGQYQTTQVKDIKGTPMQGMATVTYARGQNGHFAKVPTAAPNNVAKTSPGNSGAGNVPAVKTASAKVRKAYVKAVVKRAFAM